MPEIVLVRFVRTWEVRQRQGGIKAPAWGNEWLSLEVWGPGIQSSNSGEEV